MRKASSDFVYSHPFLLIWSWTYSTSIIRRPNPLLSGALTQLAMSTSQIGGSQAAGDIYGIGVRLGIYFQVVGFLFSAIRGKGRGIRMACGATTVALLLSWNSLVIHQNISPAE